MMAANQTTVRATEYITHGGKLYAPGEVLTGRLDPEVVKAVLLHGHASEDDSKAETAAKAEAARKAKVDEEIATRSDKRSPEERAADAEQAAA